MRVYHFLKQRYGLKDLRERRLKIARLDEVNDPFEIMPVCANREERDELRWWRAEMSKGAGMLCFSKDWSNPVQWSHYAEGHKGLCLGFDLIDAPIMAVEYRKQRLKANWTAIRGPLELGQAELIRWFTNKYGHWRYEREVRILCSLDEADPDDGLFYMPFNETETRLAEVIVGDRSQLTRADIEAALGDLAPHVDVFKARLAFRSYRVVRQHLMRMFP